MSLSLAICLMTIALIKYQFGYDQDNTNKNFIYRINTAITTKQGDEARYATSPQPLVEELKNNELIQNITPLKPTYDVRAVTDISSTVLRGFFSSDSFFTTFSFDRIPQAQTHVLENPRNVLLSEESAVRLYGNGDAIGKVLKINDWGNFMVAGVFKNQRQCHIKTDFIISYNLIRALEDSHKIESQSSSWYNYSGSYTYILLNKKAKRKNLDYILDQISKSVMKRFSFKGEEKSFIFQGQRLDEISPAKGLWLDNTPALSYSAIGVLLTVILVLMGITCFNFSSLTIARSLTRAKEIGVRKVLGASRKDVMLQFMVEATVVACISLIISLIILPFVPLNESLNAIFRQVRFDVPLIGIFLLFSVLSGIFAGFIPGLILSNFQPAQVLKSLRGIKLIKGLGFRRLLIGLQFTISIVLIFTLLVIYGQSRYMANADYGFDMKNVVSIKLPESNLQSVLRNRLSELSEVKTIAGISTNFGYQPTTSAKWYVAQSNNAINIDGYYADENILNLFQLRLLAGRNFSKDSSINKNAVIINAKAVDALKLVSPEYAIGKSIWLDDSTSKVVVGVVRDFHYKNFKSLIGPMMLQYNPGEIKIFHLKLANPQCLSTLRLKLSTLRNQLQLKDPLEYSLYEETFVDQQQHGSDVMMIGFVAMMFLGIANLGLLGMASYSTEQRIKEVSIRKILGASSQHIFFILSKEFLILILLGLIIGLPIGYLISNIFLANFSYKVIIGGKIFLTTVIFIVAVCLLMIGSQTFKTSISKPISKVD